MPFYLFSFTAFAPTSPRYAMPPKRANNAAVNAAKTVAATAVADSASPSKKAKAGAAVKVGRADET